MSRSAPPKRLIDTEGEGVYMCVRDKSWGLREVAGELFGDAREWRNLNYETVWMREGDDDQWYPVKWRWWRGLQWNFGGVVPYAYLTPKGGSQ